MLRSTPFSLAAAHRLPSSFSQFLSSPLLCGIGWQHSGAIIPVSPENSCLSGNYFSPFTLKKCHFCTSSSRFAGYKLKDDLDECYSLLNVSEDANVSEVKDAYIKCAKIYHPDSGSVTANPQIFFEVKEAYKKILEHRKCAAEEVDEVEKIIFDIRHTAPQHRQYLSFEGVGTGMPSQRQKQYQQYRVARATETIHEHRIHKLADQTENAMVVKDKIAAKKIKISNAIDRMVEDMIQDAMKKGDFDNLSLKGKPLQYVDRNPFVDTATHNINKILINNGFAPQWITLQSEIRSGVSDARRRLAVLRHKLGSPPFSSDDNKRWQSQVKVFKTAIADINNRIDKFNIMVPMMEKQMVHYNAAKDVNRIYNSCEKYLPKNTEMGNKISSDDHHYKVHTNCNSQENWSEIWQNMKSIFKS